MCKDFLKLFLPFKISNSTLTHIMLRFCTISGRVVTLTFCMLQCLLIVSLYQAWIVYSLVRKQFLPTFTDLSELLREMDAGRERLIEWDNKREMVVRYWFFEGLETNPNYPYSELRKVLAKHPSREVKSKDEIMPLMAKGGFVAVTQEDDPVAYIAVGHCQMMMVYGGMPEQNAYLVSRLGGGFIETTLWTV